MKTKIIGTIFLSAVFFFCAVTFSSADIKTLELFYKFSDTGYPPGGSLPWLTATFDDDNTAGLVELTLEATNLIPDEFVSEWYLNFDPALNPASLAIAYNSGGPAASNISTGVDAFKADGDGFFDILFEFPTALDTFGPGDSVVYDITLDGITAHSFYYLSNPKENSTGGFYSAAHVQGTGQDGEYSAWIATPIPGSVLMLGSGLIGLVFIRRKKLFK
jgi:hypothetical protein